MDHANRISRTDIDLMGATWLLAFGAVETKEACGQKREETRVSLACLKERSKKKKNQMTQSQVEKRQIKAEDEIEGIGWVER